MIVAGVDGVPRFESTEFGKKRSDYCVLIPVINEQPRLAPELVRAQAAGVDRAYDVVVCDGGSTDRTADPQNLERLGVNSLLVKQDSGKQGAQLRMGFWWALERGYSGIITVDGNNKDSIEDVPKFALQLDSGVDFVQGSRFIPGGRAVNTPPLRSWAVRHVHAPVLSLAAHHRFTDTTNAFRGYSARYLTDPRVQPFRSVFDSYELLAYLSVRASQLGLRVCEVPVSRIYPANGAVPTKIKGVGAYVHLSIILARTLFGKYNPSLASSEVA